MISALVIVLFTCFALINADPTDFENTIILAKPDLYYFSWNITNKILIGEIKVKTNGWVSFGISGNMGWLEGSDLIVSWINTDSTGAQKTTFFDSYIQSGQVQVDFIQNWNLTNSSQSNGYTIIRFKRPIILCDVDPNEDLNIEEGTPIVIYAWGETNPSGYIDYPGKNNGSKPVPLLNAIKRRGDDTTNVTTETFTMNQVNLPNFKVTNFICQFFSLPKKFNNVTNLTTVEEQHLIKVKLSFGDIKYHFSFNEIISFKYETVLQSGNEDLVHGWVMYGCPNNFKIPQVNNDLTCNSVDNNVWTTNYLIKCNQPIVMWTKGNFLVQEFPFDLGYPVGGSDSIVFIVRVHYENPDLIQDIVDSTSIIHTLTTDLRPNDVGTLVVGAINTYQGITIPPGVSGFTINTYCQPSCMNKMVSNITYINIFASMQETYRHGTSIKTKMIRNGAEYKYIARNNYYSNEYRYTLYLDPPVVLQLEDGLLTTCVYDTTSESTFQYGGDSETCLNYLYYYPRDPSISYCVSGRSPNDWANLFLNLNNSGSTLISKIPQTDTSALLVLNKMTITSSVKDAFKNFYSDSFSTNVTEYCGYDETNTTETHFKITSTLYDSKSACTLNGQQRLIVNLYSYLFVFSFVLIKHVF